MNRDLAIFDNLFRDIMDVSRGFQDDGFKTLYTDWESTEDGYVVKIEVPGIDQDGIDINVENGLLTIKAEYKEDSKECLRRGKYKWSVKVVDVDVDAITAKLDKGVLIINLPKSEKAKPKRIEILKN